MCHIHFNETEATSPPVDPQLLSITTGLEFFIFLSLPRFLRKKLEDFIEKKRENSSGGKEPERNRSENKDSRDRSHSWTDPQVANYNVSANFVPKFSTSLVDRRHKSLIKALVPCTKRWSNCAAIMDYKFRGFTKAFTNFAKYIIAFIFPKFKYFAK